ncbi:replicative DNA helicase [Candidatus Mycoplasma pogonae]
MTKNKQQDIAKIEESVLGYLLVSNSGIDLYMSLLSEDVFVNENNREIFKVLKQIQESDQKIDDNLVTHYLQKNNQLAKIGGVSRLLSLKSHAALSSNMTNSIKEMLEYNKLAKTAQLINEMQRKIQTVDGADEVLDLFETKLVEITKETVFKDFEDIYDIAKKLLQEIAEKRLNPQTVTGYKTSIRPLDNYTSGLQKSDLIILAARPSMGKTALALNLATNIARENKGTVVIFSLEMPAHQLVSRILASLSGIDGRMIKNPSLLTQESFLRLKKSQEKLQNYKILIDDQAGITLSEIIWKVKRLQKQNGDIQLVAIDYLQLISISNSSGDNRQLEVSKISRSLKQLAREINAPVLALSQLSRKVESREDKMPILSDLRESGAIEQDADIILFLYRENYYNKDKEKNSQEGKQDVIVSIAKHRNGATGRFTLNFDASLGLFTEKEN